MYPGFPVFSVRLSPDGCPENADDVAEAYWMGLLIERERLLFEAHCRRCPDCAEISSQAREFADALHATLEHTESHDCHVLTMVM
jgi:hypothetical protein